MLVVEILGNKDRPENENPELIIKTIILIYFFHIFTKNRLFITFCVNPSWAISVPIVLGPAFRGVGGHLLVRFNHR